MGRIFYKKLILEVDENVYEPREDSFLLAENLPSIRKKEKVLEIGTGSGLISILAAKKGAKVVATDINEHAISCALKNSEKNNVPGIDFRAGDLFEPIKKNEKFDLIIFNPPYLPAEKKYTDQPIDLSYNSSETLNKFLAQCKDFLKKDGRVIIVNSTISGVEIGGKIIAEQKLAFEKIFVVQLNQVDFSFKKIKE